MLWRHETRLRSIGCLSSVWPGRVGSESVYVAAMSLRAALRRSRPGDGMLADRVGRGGYAVKLNFASAQARPKRLLHLAPLLLHPRRAHRRSSNGLARQLLGRRAAGPCCIPATRARRRRARRLPRQAGQGNRLSRDDHKVASEARSRGIYVRLCGHECGFGLALRSSQFARTVADALSHLCLAAVEGAEETEHVVAMDLTGGMSALHCRLARLRGRLLSWSSGCRGRLA